MPGRVIGLDPVTRTSAEVALGIDPLTIVLMIGQETLRAAALIGVVGATLVAFASLGLMRVSVSPSPLADRRCCSPHSPSSPAPRHCRLLREVRLLGSAAHLERLAL